MPDYFAAPADQDRVTRLLQRLAALRRGLPVATTEGALSRFKVSDAAFERRVRLLRGEEPLATLYLGASPGLRQSYARTAADEAVYAVELASHELPVEAEGWLDTELMALDPGSIRELELVDGVRLSRQGESWEAEGLDADRPFDPAAAEALAMRLGGLRIERLLGSEPPADLQATDPSLMLTARTDSGELVWSLWQRGEPEAYVLHRSDRPWYAELAEWNARPLIEAASPAALLEEPAREAAAEEPTGDPREAIEPAGRSGAPTGGAEVASGRRIEAADEVDP
jgi:hypothetical protein